MNNQDKLESKTECSSVNKKLEEKAVQPRKIRVSSKSSDEGMSIKAIKTPIVRAKRVSSKSSDESVQ